MQILIAVIVSLVLSLVSALLMPKPKTSSGGQSRAMEDPTADAGRPLPVVFGTVTVKSPNVLWYGEKDLIERQVSA